MTPRRLQALEPTLREYAENLIVGFRHEEVVDLVHEFAFPFPGYAAFSLLGFPDADTEMLKEWSRTRVLLTYGELSEPEQVATAGDVVRMWRYVEDFVARRHAEPVDDLTSDLARLSRDKPDQINEFDIFDIVYSMALAGHETTTNTISSGMLALLRHRDQWQRLVVDPGAIPKAVEQILPYDGPILNHRRVATVDTRIGDIDIPAGSPIASLRPRTIRRTSARMPTPSASTDPGPSSTWRSGRGPTSVSAPRSAGSRPRSPSSC
jgi:hypothetical protein